ncbi:hypothetical protein M378DRAFT_17584 [Amanita muscaria Koide BX008]|uniref:C2H2-type domain-containing protein n=1 Tax=Amanita muscaria (strain Koide BX008) TaxID=946122 RepID=A0A0C2RZN4_AMAMK|nr:hypothetical protein M378DRAFT_17584 [Amanita muscaria Koide BX008]
MSQYTQRWPHSQKSTAAVDYNAAFRKEQLIRRHGSDSTALSPELQRQPESGQEWIFGPFLTGPVELSGTSHTFVQPSIPDVTRPWRAEEGNMALGHDVPLSQFGGNAGNGQAPWSFLIPPNGALGLPTSWLITSPDSPQSPVGPTAAGHLSSQVLTDINPQGLSPFPFSGNGHSQAGNVLSPLLIHSNGAANSPTSTGLSAQSSVGPSAAVPAIIELVAAEDGIRAVGSREIQQASGRRRKKEGNFVCPFRNTGCKATFTAPHNAQYHLNSHLGLKPYECTECSYAAAALGTLRRHMKRHQ